MSSKTSRYIQIGNAIAKGLSPEEIIPSLDYKEMELYDQLTAKKAILAGHCDFVRDFEIE